ncbi:Uncharacterized response regulatory protein SA0215 [[Eubacterium] contortum]|uniref:Stage 0 sporulation protein A homolog n=1 Tax=Faecalicatena contorta TaxID=39482 RepID=A0A174GC05_9FIRM|nr:response regulator [Faecalicatena contorta]CUO58586.1 Uncharacterized response regulatory protein SA0215 [[Eubacterium] contortum] [Faecalicatena contorta]
MKNVIIADDEVHVRSLLKHLVHWEEYGLNLAGEFDNAEDIIEFMQHEKVDIVVTDIMMPGLNGIEMIKEIKKQQIQCRFVLISGYRDFEFAQAAVKLGVSDYILKPINEDEVNAVLKSLAEEESEGGEEEFRKKAIRQKFREVLAGDTAVPDLETVEKKYCLHFQKEDAFFRVLQLGFCGCREGEEVEQVAGDIWNILRKNISECCVEQEMFPSSWLRYNIVLQIKDDMKSRILRILDTTYRGLVQNYRDNLPFHLYLGVGKAVNELNDLRISMETAAFFMSGRLRYGDSRMYVADILPQADKLLRENRPIDSSQMRRFESSVEAIDESGVKQVIRGLFEEYQKRSDQNYIQYFYMATELGNRLADVLGRLNIHPRETQDVKRQLQRLSENCDTITMLRSVTEKFCIDNMNKYLAGKKDHVLVYVHFAKQYIEEHYAENITLNRIAEEAHVNPVYLSTIFKESTGINYSAYLTSIRIEKAKELLKKLDLNISQIANQVGYASTRYFSRIFEQESGMKPSEYRRIYLKGLRDEM